MGVHIFEYNFIIFHIYTHKVHIYIIFKKILQNFTLKFYCKKIHEICFSKSTLHTIRRVYFVIIKGVQNLRHNILRHFHIIIHIAILVGRGTNIDVSNWWIGFLEKNAATKSKTLITTHPIVTKTLPIIKIMKYDTCCKP